MQYVYVSRAIWGSSAATETFIANRARVPAANKTTIQVHHTAGADNDATRNRWSLSDASAYMRKLQTSRPDLGPLPYCDNVAVSEDVGTAWIFEGRGALVLGAHTADHNWDGYGIGILGNLDFADPEAAAVLVEAIERRVFDLRVNHGLFNLGQDKNPRGWNAWGHRDTKSTSCPGNHLYPLLANFRLDLGDDDVSQALRLMVVEAAQKAWLPTQKDIDHWMNLTSDPSHWTWQAHFEPAWSNWKQQEWKKLVGHPHDAPLKGDKGDKGDPGAGGVDEAQVRALIEGSHIRTAP